MSTFNAVTGVQLLLDEAAGAVFFTVQQICDALNETLLVLTASGRWSPASASYTLTSGATLLALPSSTMMIPQFLLVAGKKYFFTTQADLERYDRYWKTTPAAQPNNFVLWDASHILPFPTPDTSYTATLWGILYPSTEFTPAAQTISLPPLLQEVLVYSAVAELLEHTHPDTADEYSGKSEETMQLFLRQLRRRQSHNISRLRPATTFQVGQSGDIRVSQLANQPFSSLP